jgi:immune inhibitor A
MQGPPSSVIGKRGRILTDAQKAVNHCASRPAGHALAAALLALTMATAEARAAPARGELRLLVVLAGFPDRPLAMPRAHFSGSPAALVDRLVAYYAEVSSGRLEIVPTVGDAVVTLPAPRARYVQRPAALARDALEAFAAAARAPADRAALARAHAAVVFFAGTGRESHTAHGPDDPWSNYTALMPPVAVGGRVFEEACVIAETEVAPFSSFGVLCHEFGHLLGLPELYAPGGLAHEGIGVWGLMGQGTWLGRGEHPPHPCAWSKARLGWVDVETIERTTHGVVLPAVDATPRVVRIPAVPGRAEEYYLLENRRRRRADARLPGEGLLVWHVDERVGGFRSAQRAAAHKLLHLVEGDGRGDLDRGHAAGGNRGDATDPWSGPPPWRRRAAPPLVLLGAALLAAAVLRTARSRPLGPVLGLAGAGVVALVLAARLRAGPVCGPGTPGMAPYDGEPVRVVIRNLSPAGETMRFDVLVAPPRERD